MIESLFPPGVEVVALTELPDGAGLLPEEEPFVARAVEKRRRDFALGRACARAALLRLGVPAGPIPVGDERAPVWPPGVIGSISHCAGLAVAAVARRSEFAGLGIDVEPAAPVEEKLFSQIATERERRWLETLGPGQGEAARRLFSAKESVYKCLHPIVGVFLGFHDCEVEMDLDGGSFVACVRSERLPAGWSGRRVDGWHGSDRNHLACAVVLRVEDGRLPSRQRSR